MARPLRVNYEGGWYHVMNRGIERRSIFTDDWDRTHFIDLISALLDRFGIEVHAYCLMDNHYHLALRTPRGNLSEGIKWLGQSYSTWFNRRHERVGPLFQGRFKSLPVDAGEWLWQLTFYIHLNPVRTGTFGLDKRSSNEEAMGAVAPPTPEEVSARLKHLRTYLWSSLRGYAGYAKAPDWLQCATVLSVYGKSQKEQRKRYREMVKDQVRRGGQETPFEQFKDQLAIGSNNFLERIKASIDIFNAREFEGKKRLRTSVDFELVVKAVEQIKREPYNVWICRHGDWGKWILLWLSHRYCGMTQSALGNRIGGMDYAAVSAGIRRLDKQIQTDKLLKTQLQTCIEKLNIET